MTPGKGGLELATEDSYLRHIDQRDERAQRTVLTFIVGGETYGLDILSIREIIKVTDVTEVPRVPGFLLGVISVRGLILPVLDLRARLQLDATPLTRAARILVAEHEGEPFGLLVDAVTGVVRFAADQIEPPPSTLAVADTGFLAGIGRYELGSRNKMVILLQLQAVVQFEIYGRRGRS